MSLVFDFASIHARMLGDLKKPPAKPPLAKPPLGKPPAWALVDCTVCNDVGWVMLPFTGTTLCHVCCNPANKPRP